MADHDDEDDIPGARNEPALPADGGGYGADDYASEGYELPPENGDDDVTDSFNRTTAVAASKSKNMLFAGLGGALMLFLLYQVFIAEDGAPPPAPPPPPPSSAAIAPPEAAPVLQPPQSVELLPPPPPPPIDMGGFDDGGFGELPPPPIADPEIDLSSIEPNNEQLIARRKSAMLVMGGGGSPEEETNRSRPLTIGLDPSNPNSNWAAEIAESEASRAVATHVGNLNQLVLQGKILHAILETAIDSTLPGTLRAIVSRDVYAEAGYDVLIPKGSRLIGSYNTDILRGQARIFIIWNRLIRPDGVDIQVSSPAMDRLGRSGMAGFLDNRFFEVFSGALLTSTFTVATAALKEAVLDTGQVTTTQNTDGSTNTTGTPTDTAFAEAMDNLSGVAEQILQSLIDLRPMITVDQGTPIKVFVNQDLEFPPGASGQFAVIP